MRKVLSPFFGLGLLVLLVGMACVVGTQATPTPLPTATLPPPPPEPPVATELDFNLDPNFGEVSLESGFTPDPYETGITSGGPVDVSYIEGCTGSATPAPDFRLRWTGSSSMLRIMFLATTAGEDTTLVVNLPDGTWACNDDSGTGGVDPMVEIANPMEGTYDIWVGSYAPDAFVAGVLRITEFSLTPSDAPSDLSSANELDFNLEPTFGEQELTAGFTPDPLDVPITSGGAVDVTYLGPDCTGYAAQAPDFRLYWTGSSTQLSFMFVPGSGDEDTTLVVNLPDGSWICNDDSTSTNRNPLLVLSSPPEGRYDIWIGSYSADDFITGTLRITETSLTP